MKCTFCNIGDNTEYDIVLTIMKNGETHIPERIRILRKDLCCDCANILFEDRWKIYSEYWS